MAGGARREVVHLKVRHPDEESSITVGAGALEGAGELLAPWLAGRLLFVVTSPPVMELHGDRLPALGAAAGSRVVLEVPDGEAAKTPEVAAGLWRRMLGAGGKRDSRLIAFGGGTVGDLGGFAAGTFLRGIDFVQVPTTLLAQVDASVGGKTGVDLPAGKNAVGVFHHPARVIADTALLATLPAGELRAGLVEVIKMAALLDPPLLARVEGKLPELLAGDPGELAPVVAAAVRAKVAVVADDPREGDRRRLLNFGHTLGHAVEACLGYAGLRHGEAVAYGLLFALRLAARRGWAVELGDRLRALLGRLDLPPLPALDAGALVAAMGRDKKARESGLVWVLPRRTGEGRMVANVGEEEVRRELAAFLEAPFDPAIR